MLLLTHMYKTFIQWVAFKAVVYLLGCSGQPASIAGGQKAQLVTSQNPLTNIDTKLPVEASSRNRPLPGDALQKHFYILWVRDSHAGK